MCAWQKFVYFDEFRLEIAIFKKAKWMTAKGGVLECTRTTTTKIQKQMLNKLHCLTLFFCSNLNVKTDESERCCVQVHKNNNNNITKTNAFLALCAPGINFVYFDEIS